MISCPVSLPCPWNKVLLKSFLDSSFCPWPLDLAMVPRMIVTPPEQSSSHGHCAGHIDCSAQIHQEGCLPGAGSLSLLQQIFLTQEWNWGLLHCRQILYQLSHQGSHIHTCIRIYIHTYVHTYVHTYM